MTETITLLLPTHNHESTIKTCIESILDTVGRSVELIVLDAGSTDGSLEILRRQTGITLVELPQQSIAKTLNHGFALAGHNDVVRLSGDIMVETGNWLDKLLNLAYDSPHAGIVGVKTVFANGHIHSFGRKIISTLGIEERYANMGWGMPDTGQHTSPHRCDSVLETMTLFRREVIDAVGGMDDAYTSALLGNDDFCLSARSKGFEVYSQPLVQVRHHAAQREFPTNDLRHWEQKWGWHPEFPDLHTIRQRWGDTNICWDIKESLAGTWDSRTPQVDILIVTWNNRQRLEDCLASIENSTYPNAKITILNNGSTDDTAEFLEKFSRQNTRYPVEIITAPINVGLPAGMNWLISQTSAPLVARLDDDVILPCDWLDRLVDDLRDYPFAGVVGPKIVYLDNPETIQFADFRWYPKTTEHRGEQDTGQYNFLARTSHVMGCCLLYHRKVFAKAGVFDIRFSPSQFEDPDHHLSVWRAGFDVLFDGRVAVKHPLTAGRVLSAAAASNSRGNFIKMEGKWGEKIFEIVETGLDKSGRKLVDERSARVSIIIPVFNNVALTQQCLGALYANTDDTVPFEVIIVDNGSTDETPQYLQNEQKQKSNLKVISNAENIGFARACNQGAQTATGDYVLFLNNDTEVQPGWLTAMLDVFRLHPDTAVVGNKLLFPDGTIQHAGVVIVRDEVLNLPLSPWHIGYRKQDEPAYNQLHSLLSVTAACMLVRKTAFEEVGGFDEKYWNGYEDVDFCFKIKQAGYEIYYQPESVVIHYESQSGAERHSQEDENLQLLQNRWQGKIIPDYVRERSGKIFPNAAIIIVTYNSESSIRMCIDSVLENTHIPAEVVVVDNASTDGTRNILARYGKRIRTILNDENLGFSAACNQGINATRGDFITLLNPDTLVTSGWLQQLRAHFKPGVGAVGPLSDYVAGRQKFQLYLPDDRPSSLNMPQLLELLHRHNRGKAVETKLLIGFCMMLSRAALDEVGLLDETLFLGNDDLDISWRLRNAGYKLLVATDTFVHHEGQVSFKTEAKSKTDTLVQQSTDRLYEKLVAHYGEGNVPTPMELWEIDWFRPSNAHFHKNVASVPEITDGLTSIIILVHNQLELTQTCLISIERYTSEPYEIIIVDNGSTDDTPAFLKQYRARHPNVRVIRNEKNVGFAAGNNQALALARGDFLLFLNNDTVVSPGWLGRLLRVLHEHPDTGIVGPVSNNVSGPQRFADVPYTNIDEFEVFATEWATQHHGESVLFPRLVGFCLLARRAVIDRIGGWDERYDIGNFEDDDFCLRTAIAGFNARIAQDVFIHHVGGQTFSELQVDYRAHTDKNWQTFTEKWCIAGKVQRGDNYVPYVLEQNFSLSEIFIPLIDPADVQPLELSAKPVTVVILLNGTEAESPEMLAETAATLAELPAELQVIVPDDWVVPLPADATAVGANVTAALADAVQTAKYVALISADVQPFGNWLAQLTAIAEKNATIAAVAPVSPVAPDAHRADTAAASPEEWTSVSVLGGFCVLFKAHPVRVVGGIPTEKPLADTLLDVFRQLQTFGFGLARADGVLVRHKNLSVAEGANFVEMLSHRKEMETLLATGQRALAQNNLETAAAEFAKIAETHPDIPEVHLALGGTLMTLKRPAEAIPALKKAVALQPGNVNTYTQLGLAYFQAGKPRKAKQMFKRVLEFDTKNLQAHLFLLDLYRTEKRFADAIRHAKAALEIDAEDTDVLVSYGLLMLDLEDVDGAEMAWRRLADAPRDHPGIVALMTGLLTRGSRQVRPSAVLAEVEAAQRAEDWTRAISLLKSVLTVNGGTPQEEAALWNRLGLSHFRAGNSAEAAIAFESGLRLSPEDMDILNNLAELHLQQSQFERATEYINRALKVNPNDTDTLMLLGNAAIQLGDLDTAQIAFQRVQMVAPETEGIDAVLRELSAAVNGAPVQTAIEKPVLAELLPQVESAQQREDWSTAVDLLTVALQFADEYPVDVAVDLLNRLGVTQFLAGNLDDALDVFQSALEFDPENRDVMGNLADVYAQLGQLDRATEYLNRALALDPNDVSTLVSLGNCAIQLGEMDVAQMAFARVQSLAPETEGIGEIVAQLNALQSTPPAEPAIAPTVVSSNGNTPTTPIFIGGAGRSGTTLVRVILDSHPHIACGPELKLTPIVGEVLQKVENELPSITENYHLPADAVPQGLRQLLQSLLMPYLAQSGKRRIAEKTPHNVAYFPQLHQIFPDSPLIHVIRDGRDVVASLLQMDWRDIATGKPMPITNDARMAASYWVNIVSRARNAVVINPTLAQRYFEIRYEDLVTDPEPILRELFSFLGEPWDAGVLHFYEQSRDLAGESSSEQVSQPLYTHAIGRWQRDLSPEQQAVVKEIAGDLLIELGYAADKNW